VIALVIFAAFAATPAAADEIWVAPTSQQDLSGLTIGSNTMWPVTPVGAVRLAWAVPDDLQTFQSAKLVVLPHAPGGAATLTTYVCAAEHADLALSACAGPFNHPFTGVTNRLHEVDISAGIAPLVGIPGQTYLAILAFTAPTTGTDHIVGLRFAYEDTPPANVATLGANTFTGTQTATAFVGDGSGLTNLPAPSGVATLGANTFGGIQTAPAFVGDGTGVSNVNANTLDGLDSTAFAAAAHGHTVTQVTGAARLSGGNTLTGSQTIDAGNLDLDPSTATAGNLTKNGQPFLHNFGTQNAFLGLNAGNLSMTGSQNLGLGPLAMASNTTGLFNVAAGAEALQFSTTGTANVAVGPRSLKWNTEGSSNVAIGFSALTNNATGLNNVALGAGAGTNVTTESNNIFLGAAVTGVAGESNAMYLGSVGTQTKAVIAGVRGTAVTGGEMVVVDADGRFGSAPVPVGGTGDITSVAAGAGLTGGGTLGDVSLSLDTAFTNALYAGVVHGHDVAQVVGAATLGANTFGATQTIDNGNLDLDPASSTTGVLMKNGARFLHDFGTDNTFLGRDAGNLTMTGSGNTAVGFVALQANTVGGFNTALGSQALSSSTFGEQNTAVGGRSLQLSTGSANVAAGYQALSANTTGSGNTALGTTALLVNTTGQNNIGIGQGAGSQSTTGSNNIFLGGFVTGVAGESNAMYLGKVGTQTKTVVAGVRGTGVAGGEMVVVDADGRLGSAPVPVGGGGDITGVAAGIGLSGGGTSGDVSVSLDLPYTDARYASIAHGHDVSVISGAATLGANTFNATQNINSGNLDLDPSGAATGVISKDGARFIHDFGSANVFVGVESGNFSLSGASNTAVGFRSLWFNTSGSQNTSLGSATLFENTTGSSNTAIGTAALRTNSSGFYNVALGTIALSDNTEGAYNTALGSGTLRLNSTGSRNIAIGASAGHASTGSDNIFLGSLVEGVAGESNAMYLGKVGTQTKTVIAGVRGTGVAGGEMVVVDADGRLGSAPVPVGGGGDITGVAAGIGLSGGGTSGDVSVSLDLPYTDARYASIAHGHDVSSIVGAATISANTFTGSQVINAGNLDLDSSTPTAGTLTKDGVRFLHDYGSRSVFVGANAGNFTSTGTGDNTSVGFQSLAGITVGALNTALGSQALSANSEGSFNTAVGSGSLLVNATGRENTAVGQGALAANISGNHNTATGTRALAITTANGNTAFGYQALYNNTAGGVNTAIGLNALENHQSGSSNVAIGVSAGGNSTTGSNNIYLGASVTGVAGESNVMYLGRVGTQTKTMIAGVRGITTSINDAVPVVIDSNGQLGTISSSARYKEDIHDLGVASRRLFDLRPVTFRYTQAFANGIKPVQFGLIAEEVAQVFPELAVVNADGQPETVKYQDLSVLLLNEVQRQQATIERQARELDEERRRVDALERRMEQLLERIGGAN
jgi:hypothetical protein